MNRGSRSEDGLALVTALVASTLLMALGSGLVLLATTEPRIAAHFVAGLEALYAADAAVEHAIADLSAAEDWGAVVAGSVRSTFADGLPSGVRITPGGVRLDLSTLTNLERCADPAPCSDDAASLPWRLFGHAPIEDLLAEGRMGPGAYAVVWVAPRDSGAPDVLVIRSRAFGPFGARRGVEATVSRTAQGLRLLAWRQL